jgi:hypothetical protein
MLITILLVAAGACVFGIAASVVMSWASNRSPVWNMVFAGVVVVAFFAGLAVTLFLVTRAAFPR